MFDGVASGFGNISRIAGVFRPNLLPKEERRTGEGRDLKKPGQENLMCRLFLWLGALTLSRALVMITRSPSR